MHSKALGLRLLQADACTEEKDYASPDLGQQRNSKTNAHDLSLSRNNEEEKEEDKVEVEEEVEKETDEDDYQMKEFQDMGLG
ncbi:hypothetical protein CHS0354_037575 [Potamilus streckersoni]|uniref:Uncharacterized protein n=1 Tax=Potamilus streckersoni TaxID=2493646 RepID=A0AAE0SUX3_9BIVA|nr:hypothetical protein CHS0354_037575 [Potamilus streckersoni]